MDRIGVQEFPGDRVLVELVPVGRVEPLPRAEHVDDKLIGRVRLEGAPAGVREADAVARVEDGRAEVDEARRGRPHQTAHLVLAVVEGHVQQLLAHDG